MEILNNLLQYDQKLFQEKDCDLIIGLDEVGRGALAGPVLVSAYASLAFTSDVDLKKQTNLSDLNDSKKVKPSARAHLVDALKYEIKDSYYAIQENSAAMIDDEGIVKAIFDAMKQALLRVLQDFQEKSHSQLNSILVLVDGIKLIPGLEEFLIANGFNIKIDQVAVKKGDTTSASIAAASNIAKYYRDQLMIELADKNPDLEVYSWRTNVGYGSKKHRDALFEYGLTEYHRQSFCKFLKLPPLVVSNIQNHLSDEV